MGQFVFHGPGGKIDIYEGIQLIQDDIYIVGADPGGDDRNPFFPRQNRQRD